MIIYNVTISVDESVEQEWLTWMREIHIPEVLATGLFLGCRFSKLISHKEEGHQSYVAQYACNSKADLENYKQNFAADLQRKSMVKFADKMLAFRTELEVVQDF